MGPKGFFEMPCNTSSQFYTLHRERPLGDPLEEVVGGFSPRHGLSRGNHRLTLAEYCDHSSPNRDFKNGSSYTVTRILKTTAMAVA